MSAAHAGAPRRRRLRGPTRDSTALAVGTIASGVLAYVFFALATRTLGGDDAAPVAQLWTWWSASAAVLTFPVQHWIIRVVHASGGPAAVRRALPRVTALAVGLSVVVALASWAARVPLFARTDAVFPLLAAVVTLGAFLVGVVRGRLAGADRFAATGAVIAGENLLRVALALAVVVAGGGVVGFGVALAAGAAAVLAWPSTLRFADGAAPVTPEPGSPLVFLGGIAAGSLIAQLVLTGGPVVLAAVGGQAREVTALFTTLALFRAPYVLALGLVTRITGTLTDLVVAGREDRLRRLRGGLVVATAAGAGAGWVAGRWLGAPAIDLVFGRGIAPSQAIVAAVAVATALGLANLVWTVLLVARGSSSALTACWVAAVAVGGLAVVVLPVPPLPSVTWAFLAAELTAFVLMWWRDARASARPSTDAGSADPPSK